MNLILSLSLT